MPHKFHLYLIVISSLQRLISTESHKMAPLIIFSPSLHFNRRSPFNRIFPSNQIILHVLLPRSPAGSSSSSRRSGILTFLDSQLLDFFVFTRSSRISRMHRYWADGLFPTKKEEGPRFEPSTLGTVSGDEDHFTMTPPLSRLT